DQVRGRAEASGRSPSDRPAPLPDPARGRHVLRGGAGVSARGDAKARMIPLPVWSDRHTVACRRQPAVVAVWEGAGGRLALLLRHTVFPLPTERTSWLIETADVAGPVIDDLRQAGCWGAPIVLNWRPLGTIAHVARTWRLRYDAD